MNTVYKYYSNESEYAISNLKQDLISFSSTDSLNDPFEGYGHFSLDLSEEASKYWNSIKRPDIPQYINKDILEKYREYINFNYRVFSSTVSYKNPLFWAYYANSHKGFCIGYDIESLGSVSNKIEPINYQNRAFDIESIKRKEELYKILFVKSDVWTHENEIRAIYSISNNDIKHDTAENYCKYNNSKNIIAMLNPEFPDTLLSNRYIMKECKPVSIYLGLSIDSQLQRLLIEIAKNKRIPIYKMYQNQNDFEMKDYPIIL